MRMPPGMELLVTSPLAPMVGVPMKVFRPLPKDPPRCYLAGEMWLL
jgi:hypothetical protein